VLVIPIPGKEVQERRSGLCPPEKVQMCFHFVPFAQEPRHECYEHEVLMLNARGRYQLFLC
jgi:hypothetical protein